MAPKFKAPEPATAKQKNTPSSLASKLLSPFKLKRSRRTALQAIENDRLATTPNSPSSTYDAPLPTQKTQKTASPDEETSQKAVGERDLECGITTVAAQQALGLHSHKIEQEDEINVSKEPETLTREKASYKAPQVAKLHTKQNIKTPLKKTTPKLFITVPPKKTVLVTPKLFIRIPARPALLKRAYTPDSDVEAEEQDEVEPSRKRAKAQHQPEEKPFMIRLHRRLLGGENASTFVASVLSEGYPKALDVPSEPVFWVKREFPYSKDRFPEEMNSMEVRAHKRLAAGRAKSKSSATASHVLELSAFADLTILTRELFFVFPLAKIDLYDAELPGDPAKRRRTLQVWLAQATSAIFYIHSIGIIHRDIKPENYVLDFNDNVLLTDFGFAFVTQEEGPLDHNAAYDFFNCGTSLYKAPEVEVNEWPRFIAYTPAVDFYSLGCVMLSVAIEHKSDIYTEGLLSYGEALAEAKLEDGLINEKKWAVSVFKPLGVDDFGLCHLIWTLLKPNPKERATPREVRTHRYFTVYTPGRESLPIFDTLHNISVNDETENGNPPDLRDFVCNLQDGKLELDIVCKKDPANPNDYIWVNEGKPPKGVHPNVTIKDSLELSELKLEFERALCTYSG